VIQTSSLLRERHLSFLLSKRRYRTVVIVRQRQDPNRTSPIRTPMINHTVVDLPITPVGSRVTSPPGSEVTGCNAGPALYGSAITQRRMRNWAAFQQR